MQRISRRGLLQAGLCAAAGVLLARDGAIEPADTSGAGLDVARGVTFIPGDVRYWGRDLNAVLDGLLQTEGLEVVRMPLYSWETAGRDGRWFFQRYRAPIERILNSGRKIIPVVGIKQPGYPEVHLPWRIRRDSTADEAGVVLDSDAMVRQFALAVVAADIDFLKDYTEGIAAVQVENEANYPVGLANGRRISNEFLAEEVAMVRAGLPNCTIMCTYPDTPGLDWGAMRIWFEGLKALQMADVVGFNLYPQKAWEDAGLDRQFTMRWIRHISFPTVRSMGVKPAIAEMQVTPWVEGKDGDIRPFSVNLNREDVRTVEGLDPSLLLLWGVDYAAAPGQERLWQHVTSLFAPAGQRTPAA